MITLILSLVLQVAVSGEMACTGSVMNSSMPANLYVAGVQMEGVAALAVEGQIVYLNGPRVGSLKVGDINAVVRPEGTIRDPSTGMELGFYYRDLGTVQIEAVRNGHATARVLHSCYEMTKGDLVIPQSEKPLVEFQGELSNALTSVPPDGPRGTILLGRDDLKELSKGQICFIDLGRQNGIEVGDRFTVFRPGPLFNRNELEEAGAGTSKSGSHSIVAEQNSRKRLDSLLSTRTLPDIILGDIIVLDVGEKVSTGKIINSLEEIHPGDFIVKR